ncbi:MAG: SiaB family protein kinase [Bacteroidales bacterium]|nr:SiaB family protein kinase [Bacteroidales bacterium]
MVNNQVILEHQGDLSFDLIGDFLSQLNRIMDQMAMELNSKKILYSIMVECLENIYRHFDMDNEEIPAIITEYNTNFSLKQANDDTFVLKAGNLIWNKNIPKLKEKLDLVNSLDKNGLKNLYKNAIRNITLHKEDGAGLGIIDIAKLSGNKLIYSFQNISNEISYFHLTVTISGLIHYKKLSV